MDVRDVLSAARKRWILVLSLFLVGVVGGIAWVARATPTYRSSLSFFVATPTSDDASALAADQFATRRVNSYVRLASSERLATLVIRDTGLSIDPVALSHEVAASADLNTVILTVSVTDPNKARSLRISQSLTTQFPKLIRDIEPVVKSGDRVRLTVVSAPRLDPFPIRPSRLTTIGLGAFAGLFLGLLIAVLRELTDTTVQDEAALRTATGVPVLGAVPIDTTAPKEPLLVGRQTWSFRAEAVRHLRTNLQFMDVDKPLHVIVVTSSVANEGKSTTCANLAIVFAESGRRTLLIEADLRHPKLTEYLGLERSVGLSNVLAGQVDVDEVLQPWGDGPLTVLSGGTVPPNPSEMLGSHGMSELIKRLRERFEIIIIDTPPLLPVTDAAVASVHADGVVMVVRSGRTSRAQISTALESLAAVDARVVGAVLNMVKPHRGNRAVYERYGYPSYRAKPPADDGSAIRIGPKHTTATDVSDRTRTAGDTETDEDSPATSAVRSE